MKEIELYRNLLKGDEDAVRFIAELASCSQVMDDLIDQDKDVKRAQMQQLFWRLMISLPNNPFYRAHYHAIWPVMAMGLNDWFVANDIESDLKDEVVSSEATAVNVSFVIRDNLAQVLSQCVLLIGGCDWLRSNARKIRDFVHDESLDKYKGGLV